MIKPIEQRTPNSQKSILVNGRNIVQEKYYRSVKTYVRNMIINNALKPERIDFLKVIDSITQAMTFVWMISSGKIGKKADPLKFAEEDIIVGIDYDTPFIEAIEAWLKANPDQKSFLDRIRDAFFLHVSSYSGRIENIVRDAILHTIATGSGIAKVAREIETITGQAAQTFEDALRTNVAIAQNAGHYNRLQQDVWQTPIWEYRAVDDDRTTGFPGGIYQDKTGKNPGFCHQLNGFKAVANHPIWQKIYPPNHINCRSLVVGLEASYADKAGYLDSDGNPKDRFINPKIPWFVEQGLWPPPNFSKTPLGMLGI